MMTAVKGNLDKFAGGWRRGMPAPAILGPLAGLLYVIMLPVIVLALLATMGYLKVRKLVIKVT